MFGAQALPPPRPSLDPLSTVWECYQSPAELLDAADWLLEGSPRAGVMPSAPQQFAAPSGCGTGSGAAALAPSAPLPFHEAARQGSWRASTDGSSHMTRVSSAQTEGVESWLAGWQKVAEEQGCAVSPLETSSMQALLQRMGSQPMRRAPSTHVQEPALARRPAGRASCDFGRHAGRTSCDFGGSASVPLQPPRSSAAQQQWSEGVACYQQYSAPQPALSDGGSNSAGHGPSGESSHYRNSEDMYSGYSRGLGSGVQQQGSPCQCCGRSAPPAAQRPPPHPGLQHGAQQLQQHCTSYQAAACQRRQAGSLDLPPPRVPRPRSSMEAWGESGAIAAARADALASLAVRAHKRKSEEVVQPPPVSHARLPATATNWAMAMGSSFYSSSAPLPVQPQAQAQGQFEPMHKRPHSGTDPHSAAASVPHSRANTPPRRGCSFDRQRASVTPTPTAPAAVRGTPELPCGSFLQAMQEAAAAAPILAQPFHQQSAQQGPVARQAPASPCVFSMLDWNEMLPDELLAP